MFKVPKCDKETHAINWTCGSKECLPGQYHRRYVEYICSSESIQILLFFVTCIFLKFFDSNRCHRGEQKNVYAEYLKAGTPYVLFVCLGFWLLFALLCMRGFVCVCGTIVVECQIVQTIRLYIIDETGINIINWTVSCVVRWSGD